MRGKESGEAHKQTEGTHRGERLAESCFTARGFIVDCIDSPDTRSDSMETLTAPIITSPLWQRKLIFSLVHVFIVELACKTLALSAA